MWCQWSGSEGVRERDERSVGRGWISDLQPPKPLLLHHHRQVGKSSSLSPSRNLPSTLYILCCALLFNSVYSSIHTFPYRFLYHHHTRHNLQSSHIARSSPCAVHARALPLPGCQIHDVLITQAPRPQTSYILRTTGAAHSRTLPFPTLSSFISFHINSSPHATIFLLHTCLALSLYIFLSLSLHTPNLDVPISHLSTKILLLRPFQPFLRLSRFRS